MSLFKIGKDTFCLSYFGKRDEKVAENMVYLLLFYFKVLLKYFICYNTPVIKLIR